MKKVLITGASGLLGSHLVRYFLNQKYNVIGTHGSRQLKVDFFKTEKLDLRDTNSIANFILSHSPEVVIHSAAATDIDWCEKEIDECNVVNFLATKEVVKACKFMGSKLIYISTPSVFGSNASNKKLKEGDKLKPRSFYSKTKKNSEDLVLTYENSVVVRLTPFGHSPSLNHLTDWAISNSIKKNKIFGYTDSIFNPIFAGNVGFFLEKIISKNAKGALHLGCKNAISKFDFINKVLKSQKIDEDVCSTLMANHRKNKNCYRNSNNFLCLDSAEKILETNFQNFDLEIVDFVNYKNSGNYKNVKLVHQ